MYFKLFGELRIIRGGGSLMISLLKLLLNLLSTISVLLQIVIRPFCVAVAGYVCNIAQVIGSYKVDISVVRKD